MNMHRIALLAAAAMAGFSAGSPAQASDSEWRRKVSQLISANYSYPRSAQLRGEQGKARIKIAIAGSGKVVAVNLVESSGSAILDREALRILMKVGAFPPPPAKNNVELTYPIVFKINE